MKKYLFASPIFLLFLSCSESNNEKVETKPVATETTVAPASLNGCYEMVISGDTAFMNIEQSSDNLNGVLKYKRKDKDSNNGKIVLTKTGNRAEGFYTFQSEGLTSVRQIVFKINNNSFAEGYGNIEMKNDTAVFKYPHALNFEEKHTFNKVTCK